MSNEFVTKPDIFKDCGGFVIDVTGYGLPFYLHIDFVPLSNEQEINGIRFVPMKYVIA